MNKRRQILLKLLNRERVRITPENYLSRLKLSFVVFTVLSALTITLVLFTNEKSLLLTGVCAVISLASIFLIYYLAKNLNSASIKGDTIIINSLTKPSKVASLRSVRRVKTQNVLGISMTKINYSLDGKNNTVMFVDTARSMPIKPDVILNNAIKRSKKRKANHKPGPVTVN